MEKKRPTDGTRPDMAATLSRELEAETRADPGFLAVLEQAGASLIVTTHPGHIACFGTERGELTSSYTRCAIPFGIASTDRLLAVATHRAITVFALSSRLAPHYPARPAHYDAVFVPVGGFQTGECSIHDIVLDSHSAVFANTQFSCLSRAEGTVSFIPVWKPDFISALLPEDRCHLNSFALAGGRIRYATAFAPTDTRRGYRDMPLDSGVLIDVEANAIAAVGLLKPHSVRMFDDELYVLNSAAGEVLRVDLLARRSDVLADLPGFTRGLRALGDVLLVGISTLRASSRQLNLPLTARHDTLVAGIAAIDRRSGQVLGMLHLPASITEVFDFVTVPGVRRSYVQDPAGSDPHVGMETPDGSYWMKAGTPPVA